jgi:hypothetical protein
MRRNPHREPIVVYDRSNIASSSIITLLSMNKFLFFIAALSLFAYSCQKDALEASDYQLTGSTDLASTDRGGGKGHHGHHPGDSLHLDSLGHHCDSLHTDSTGHPHHDSLHVHLDSIHIHHHDSLHVHDSTGHGGHHGGGHHGGGGNHHGHGG